MVIDNNNLYKGRKIPPRRVKKVILDTNFLLMPYQFKVDIISELERVLPFSYSLNVLEGTVEELEKIIESQPKQAGAARMGLKIIENNNINILSTDIGGTVDDQIAGLSGDFIIATHDKELKSRLKGVPKIILRQKKYLQYKEA